MRVLNPCRLGTAVVNGDISDQRRNAWGYTGYFYIPRPKNSQPSWARDLGFCHDKVLMDLRTDLLHSEWMLDNLCRDLLASIGRAAKATGVVYAARHSSLA